MDKITQRKNCLAGRKNLSIEQRRRYSQKICRDLSPFLKNGLIMSYLPYGSEVDVSLINSDQMAYPIIIGDGIMEAYLPEKGCFMKNCYGIAEPDIEYSRKIEPEEIELIIVPVVGFDENLNRLGHGEGYYDRFLSLTKALKIGVAFEIQKQTEIIHDSNDICLDLIITEKKIYQKKKQN